MLTSQRRSMLATAALAGLVYAMGMFAIGFAMGAVRLILLVPLLEELLAVIVEIPVMLAFSWLLCGRAIKRHRVSPLLAARVVMSLSAFSSLMIADISLGVLLFGESFSDVLLGWTTAAGAIGLGGQILFGLFPLLRLRSTA